MLVLDYLFAAIPMLGLLIFVHELGHFVVAKACGVRVLKFSLGFGSPIGFGQHRLRWERGGTEYVIAWIPLGGFVRMLGEQLPGDEREPVEIPDDVTPDEYLESKPTWQKLSIMFAGPAMNLALPVLLFSIMLWAGIPKVDAVVGMVERASPAAAAGLLPGDRILSVAGEPVRFWDEVDREIRRRTDGELELVIERDGTPRVVALDLGSRSALDEYGDVRQIGWVGLDSQRMPTLVGVPDGDSPAARAGVHSGDRILRVGEREVEDWEQLRAAYVALASSEPRPESVEIGLARGIEEDAPTLTVVLPLHEDLRAAGIISASVLVGKVLEGAPAERAGLAEGDLILSVDGLPVGSFRTFADTVRSSQGRALQIAFARDGVVHDVQMSPEEREVAGPFGIDGMEEKVYQVGIAHAMATLPGVMAVDQERNPIVALPRAVEMTAAYTGMLLRGLGKLLTFQLGADQVRGPITIIQIARKSLDLGWQAYLITMIFISINLGVLNLLPIPILDGGQILIASIEGIKRSPISLRTRELVQQAGFMVLVLLMGLAFWNDLSAQFEKFIEWLGTEL
ncbi:MAG: RIP metalloprotease RseP [Deltaproteobacteria bacterium]|nr:RIP metalloprotease RseP [Deltaproteobacteria bacterium]